MILAGYTNEKMSQADDNFSDGKLVTIHKDNLFYYLIIIYLFVNLLIFFVYVYLLTFL